NIVSIICASYIILLSYTGKTDDHKTCQPYHFSAISTANHRSYRVRRAAWYPAGMDTDAPRCSRSNTGASRRSSQNQHYQAGDGRERHPYAPPADPCKRGAGDSGSGTESLPVGDWRESPVHCFGHVWTAI